MMGVSLLLLAMQVGPNPTPVDLPPLPVHERDKPQQAEVAVPRTSSASAAEKAIIGNAAIVEGDFDRAIALFDEARSLALAEGKPVMAAEIGLDHARALMLLGRNDEASVALDQIRLALPGKAEAWVISSVNARRLDDFAKAQRLIEEAVQFAPQDPGVGLEAGTIAYLTGNFEAASRSWQSVIDTSPESDEAEFAKQYLESAAIEASHGTDSSE